MEVVDLCDQHRLGFDWLPACSMGEAPARECHVS
jgi:hypothetical protein